ncbi:unnamed protein product [Porites evermanni]|uniref:Vomeronasal type-1 receptor n=1 Tax=Porites evermanni TaxID=104178 RepID=A0ABN8LUJ8_9CNID|nr:unnamed protein product [Porites evermanni]
MFNASLPMLRKTLNGFVVPRIELKRLLNLQLRRNLLSIILSLRDLLVTIFGLPERLHQDITAWIFSPSIADFGYFHWILVPLKQVSSLVLFRSFRFRHLEVSTCPPRPVIEGPGYKLESTVNIASIASGTTDAYRRSFWKWRNFACSRDEIQVFPASTEHVALYLQYMLTITRSHSALGSAIYGIQWAHNLTGIPSPPDSPIIQAVSNATK